MPSYRMNSGFSFEKPSKKEGKNHPGGVMIHYYLKDTTKALASLEILENNGKLIKKYSTKADKKLKEEDLKIKPGSNRFVWNMRYPNAEGFDGMIMWSGSLLGPKAVPALIEARLHATDSDVRRRITAQLRHIGTPEALAAITPNTRR